MQKMILNPGFYIGSLNVKWYGVIMAFSIVVGMVLAYINAPKRGIKRDKIISVALCAVPLAVVGARLFYVAFYAEKNYSFVEILKIWEGGNAIYGGLIGGAIGIAIYCIFTKTNFLKLADVIVPGLALAQAVGRWGNFINQEAFGEVVTNSNLQWFPFSVFIDADGLWHYATFFYECVWNLIAFSVLMILLYKTKERNGLVMSCYFILYGVGRALIESIRTDALGHSIRVCRLISILIAIVGVVLVIYIMLKDKKNEKLKNSKKVKK